MSDPSLEELSILQRLLDSDSSVDPEAFVRDDRLRISYLIGNKYIHQNWNTGFLSITPKGKDALSAYERSINEERQRAADRATEDSKHQLAERKRETRTFIHDLLIAIIGAVVGSGLTLLLEHMVP